MRSPAVRGRDQDEGPRPSHHEGPTPTDRVVPCPSRTALAGGAQGFGQGSERALPQLCRDGGGRRRGDCRHGRPRRAGPAEMPRGAARRAGSARPTSPRSKSPAGVSPAPRARHPWSSPPPGRHASLPRRRIRRHDADLSNGRSGEHAPPPDSGRTAARTSALSARGGSGDHTPPRSPTPVAGGTIAMSVTGSPGEPHGEDESRPPPTPLTQGRARAGLDAVTSNGFVSASHIQGDLGEGTDRAGMRRGNRRIRPRRGLILQSGPDLDRYLSRELLGSLLLLSFVIWMVARPPVTRGQGDSASSSNAAAAISPSYSPRRSHPPHRLPRRCLLTPHRPTGEPQPDGRVNQSHRPRRCLYPIRTRAEHQFPPRLRKAIGPRSFQGRYGPRHSRSPVDDPRGVAKTPDHDLTRHIWQVSIQSGITEEARVGASGTRSRGLPRRSTGAHESGGSSRPACLSMGAFPIRNNSAARGNTRASEQREKRLSRGRDQFASSSIVSRG